MDSGSHELAQQGLEAYEAALAPFYNDLRAQLAGNLATNAAHLADLRSQEAQRRNNYGLIADFMDLLPANQDTTREDDIKVQDAYEARQVHANLLWLNEPYSYSDNYGTVTPYYIIGQRQGGSDAGGELPKACQLLLYSTCPSRRDNWGNLDALKVVTVWEDEYRASEKKPQLAAFREFTAEEMRRMFDPETGMLRIYLSPESMRTQLARPTHGYLPRAFRPQKMEKMLSEKGMHVKLDGSCDGVIDDADLAAFDVFTSLNRLATAFGKTAELADLHEKYKSLAPRNTAGTDFIE